MGLSFQQSWELMGGARATSHAMLFSECRPPAAFSPCATRTPTKRFPGGGSECQAVGSQFEAPRSLGMLAAVAVWPSYSDTLGRKKALDSVGVQKGKRQVPHFFAHGVCCPKRNTTDLEVMCIANCRGLSRNQARPVTRYAACALRSK